MCINRTIWMLIWSLLPLANASAIDLRDMKLPAGATTQWVASDMNHNGYGLAVKALAAQQSVDEVLQFYRNAWGNNEPESETAPQYLESEVDGWRLISLINTSHSLVVQLRPVVDGSTEGFISSMALDSKPTHGFFEIPKLPNSSLVSKTSTIDQGKSGSTSIWVTAEDVGGVTSFYSDKLERDRWSFVSGEIVQGSQVLVFKKQGFTLEIVVSQAGDGSTVIVQNGTQNNE